MHTDQNISTSVAIKMGGPHRFIRDTNSFSAEGLNEALTMLKASPQSKFSDDEDEGLSGTDSTSSSLRAHLSSKLIVGSKNAGDHEDEDDIPLAQSIPGALKAQKSIRIRAKAYRSAEPSKLEMKQQPVSSEFTESLFSRSTLPKKILPVASQASQASPSPISMNQAPFLPPEQLSRSPQAMSPISPMSSNALWASKSRSRNKSFSQQPFHADLTHHSNEKSVLSRSSTRSVPSKGSPNIHTPIDSSARPTPPPSRAQTLPVRTRSKSFSSSSRVPNHPPYSNEQVPHWAPPLPTHHQLQFPAPSDNGALQHRVFIDSMQRFNSVLIQAHTSAYEIITMIAAQGELGNNLNDALKDWMLWEIVQDFGLERPIRYFERPSEIYASWNSNTRLNAFMLKKTPLCSILAPDKIPSTSPTVSGYVQWETKRGKWNKRWMELSEHSIWLSKRNTEKDRIFLCSISSFDCYFMSRQYKAPKSFVFALKSTDNLTMFENPADYMHTFSCDPKDGVRWTQAILLARSYVLHKERTVLFTSPISHVTPANTQSHSDHRDRKKYVTTHKPLLELQTQRNGSLDDSKEIFQSGSLLARS